MGRPDNDRVRPTANNSRTTTPAKNDWKAGPPGNWTVSDQLAVSFAFLGHPGSLPVNFWFVVWTVIGFPLALKLFFSFDADHVHRSMPPCSSIDAVTFTGPVIVLFPLKAHPPVNPLPMVTVAPTPPLAAVAGARAPLFMNGSFFRLLPSSVSPSETCEHVRFDPCSTARTGSTDCAMICHYRAGLLFSGSPSAGI